MLRARALTLVAALGAATFAPMSATADTMNDGFEAMTVGSPNQAGWSFNPGTTPLDYEIVDPAATPTAPTTFGTRALRMSNAVTTQGQHGKAVFTPSLVDEVGDTDATSAGRSGGARQPRLTFAVDVISALPSYQHGLQIGISPVRGDTARMSLVTLRDAPDGLAIDVWDYHEPASGCPATEGTGPFRLRTLVTGLSRASVHRIGMELTANAGTHDDTVIITVDGARYWGGASWEGYFRCEQTHLPGAGATSRTMDQLMFRVMSGDPLPNNAGDENENPANEGFGLLFDNVTLSSGPAPTTAPSRFDCDVPQVDTAAAIDSLDAIQQGVEILGRTPGNVLELEGTCDVSSVAASGATATGTGTTTAAIVLPDDGRDLTIGSLDPAAPATIVGSGTQAGIYVAPGNVGSTIRDLRFSGLAQPVIAHNTTRTTIGALGLGGTLGGNRIIGGATTNAGILGLGDSVGGSVTVADGAGDVHVFATPGGQALTGFTVRGNYVSFNPPGADAIGISVYQRGGGRVHDADITGNAVGLASTDYPSMNMQGIRVWAEAGNASPLMIDGVVIEANNLGRLEEVAEISNEIADIQAVGRFGIVVNRAGDVHADGNGIRVRLSPTPGISTPGGGILFGNVDGGSIDGNGIIVLSDATGNASDLGAIGIIDGANKLFGGSGAGPLTRDISVAGNIIGFVASDSSVVGAGKGLVVNGASGIEATANQFKRIEEKSIYIGASVTGFGPAGSAPTIAPSRIQASSFCGNWLNTTSTAPADRDTPLSQISFVGGLGSSGNRFPGGQAHAGNARC